MIIKKWLLTLSIILNVLIAGCGDDSDIKGACVVMTGNCSNDLRPSECNSINGSFYENKTCEELRNQVTNKSYIVRK